MDKYIYIVPESEILSSLTFVDLAMKRDGDETNYSQFRDYIIRNYGKTLEKLVKYIKQENSKIRLLITPTVYHENKHCPTIMEFVRENCYARNINSENYKDYLDAVTELAPLYSKPYVDEDGILQNAPMKEYYSAHDKMAVPSNYAYKMAETTVSGGCLLTERYKVYIYTEKGKVVNRNNGGQFFLSDIAEGIREINFQNGYFDESNLGYITIPKPVGIDLMCKLIEKNGVDKIHLVLHDDPGIVKFSASDLEDIEK